MSKAGYCCWRVNSFRIPFEIFISHFLYPNRMFQNAKESERKTWRNEMKKNHENFPNHICTQSIYYMKSEAVRGIRSELTFICFLCLSDAKGRVVKGFNYYLPTDWDHIFVCAWQFTHTWVHWCHFSSRVGCHEYEADWISIKCRLHRKSHEPDGKAQQKYIIKYNNNTHTLSKWNENEHEIYLMVYSFIRKQKIKTIQ